MVVDRYGTEGIQAGTKVAKNDVRMSFKCHYAWQDSSKDVAQGTS